jgi:anti-sigma factor RsiW
MTAHEIHALSGAYAVDALDPEERARFEEHLAHCAECQAEVAGLQEAAALFPEISATEPPADLRERVLAEIATVRPLPPVTEQVTRRRPRWVNAVAAAAAAVAFFGGGAVVWQATHETTQTSAADRVIQARDADHVSVDLPGGVSATVYRSLSEGRAAIVTRHMRPAPHGHVYQLWLQKDGRMVPAGLMTTADDHAQLLRGDVAGATGAGITVEPEGGSEEPTTPPIALFDFEKAT